MGPPYHVRPYLCFMLMDNIYISNSVIWYIRRSQLGVNYSKPWRNRRGTEASGLGPLRLGVLNDTQTWLKVKAGRRLDVLETHNACGITGGITYVDHMNHTVGHRCISTSIIYSIFSSLFFSSLILIYSLCLNLPIYRFTYLPRLSTDLFVNPM